MRTGHEFDLTVSDLLQGGDDIARLAGEESGPDAWVEVGERPRTRLTAALVAALGALAGDHDDRTPGYHGQRADGFGHSAASRSMSGLPEPVAMTGFVQPRGRSGVVLRCLVCGEWFVSGRRDRRTCSDTCRRADAATRRAGNAADVRRCAGCGRPLAGGRSDRRHCDVRCRMRAYRRRRSQANAG